jgi:MFS family permease
MLNVTFLINRFKVQGKWSTGRRTFFVTCAIMLALLSATVAIAQASQDFDLACRIFPSGGGGTITGGQFAVTGALGSSIVPPRESETNPTYSVRSANYGLRGGFLPGYPTGQSFAVTEVTVPSQSLFNQFLPTLYRVGDFVRGGC